MNLVMLQPELTLGQITIIGCGGVGARIFPTLVKMLPSDREWTIHAVDPDRVEERNLIRQPFTQSDIGRPKAEVMAARYSSDNVRIKPFVETVQDYNQRSSEANMLIAAVDRSSARREILRRSRRLDINQYPHIYIDIGCDGNRGQVVLASGLFYWIDSEGCSRTQKIFCAPRFADVFNAPDEEGGGCGLRIDTQTPLSNHMAASYALQYIGSIVFKQPIGTVGLTYSTRGAVDWIRPELVNSVPDYTTTEHIRAENTDGVLDASWWPGGS